MTDKVCKKYREWVEQQDCCHCLAPADDAHHIKGVGHFSGVGMKAPDWLTMPLCRVCHNAFHADHSLWSLQWEYITRTINRAFEEGIITFNLKVAA